MKHPVGFFFIFLSSLPAAAAPPFQATGIKIGEVSHDSAIVWTRLTRDPEANPTDGAWFDIRFEKSGWVRAPDNNRGKRERVLELRYDGEAAGPDDLRWAVPGAPGETRVAYRLEGDADWKTTGWEAVEPEWDHTVQHRLEGLRPGVPYLVKVESRGPGGGEGSSIAGRFVTAPAPDDTQKVEFAVSTGQGFWNRNSDDGWIIYDTLLKKHPDLDFFVHTGDIVYYDRLAKTPALANWHWQRTYSRGSNVRFHRNVASYFIKDDHDTLTNDCWPTMNPVEMGTFTFEKGLDIFVHQVPMNGRRTYRTRRWGKDLQVWMVEGRDFRSANTDPDGPDKTIWGAEQMAWFRKTFAESDATFRVLVSPTPIIGPDRDRGKNDNHSNKVFSHEGNRLRDFLASQENAFVCCGDRHWQYHSIDPRTGLHEFSCGPASDKHAGGWNQKDYRPDIHQFLRVKGGYLTVTTERIDGKPRISFRHFSETGEMANEKVFE